MLTKFWWPKINNNLVLAREVAACRPTKACDWDEIAIMLNTLFSSPEREVDFKGKRMQGKTG